MEPVRYVRPHMLVDKPLIIDCNIVLNNIWSDITINTTIPDGWYTQDGWHTPNDLYIDTINTTNQEIFEITDSTNVSDFIWDNHREDTKIGLVRRIGEDLYHNGHIVFDEEYNHITNNYKITAKLRCL